jgi:hypothetical protein
LYNGVIDTLISISATFEFSSTIYLASFVVDALGPIGATSGVRTSVSINALGGAAGARGKAECGLCDARSVV